MVYLDDSIMVKGEKCTVGSKILGNFASPFTATVVERLDVDFETVPLGEFGMAAPPSMPKTPLLCNDVFGFIREMAAKDGFVYIRPTYGSVSRYGLVPIACSMDQIGVLCKNTDEGFELLGKIAGRDEKDGAMLPQNKYSYDTVEQTIRFAVCLSGYKSESETLRQRIANAGIKDCKEMENKYFAAADAVHSILAYGEASNNISRYDGVKFGYRTKEYRNLAQLYTKSRTEGFGQSAKLAALMGAYVLSQGNYEKYYEKAMKVRRLISESLNFGDYDVLIVSPKNHVAVLAGLPSISFGGMQFVAKPQNEGVLRAALETLK